MKPINLLMLSAEQVYSPYQIYKLWGRSNYNTPWIEGPSIYAETGNDEAIDFPFDLIEFWSNIIRVIYESMIRSRLKGRNVRTKSIVRLDMGDEIW